MFGTNDVASQAPSGTYLVHSIFPTIQGEGPQAGMPAVFVRFAKCNLRCTFCDTDFDTGQERSLSSLVEEITAVAVHFRLIVLTGGEPLLYDLAPLVRELNKRRLSVAIETAGTLKPITPLTPLFFRGNPHNNLIVCSPKTPKISPDIYILIRAWKYIVKADELADDGLPGYSTQIAGQPQILFRPLHIVPQLIWVQPCDEYDQEANKRNQLAAVKSCLRFGYNLSLQIHKELGLP